MQSSRPKLRPRTLSWSAIEMRKRSSPLQSQRPTWSEIQMRGRSSTLQSQRPSWSEIQMRKRSLPLQSQRPSDIHMRTWSDIPTATPDLILPSHISSPHQANVAQQVSRAYSTVNAKRKPNDIKQNITKRTNQPTNQPTTHHTTHACTQVR